MDDNKALGNNLLIELQTGFTEGFVYSQFQTEVRNHKNSNILKKLFYKVKVCAY